MNVLRIEADISCDLALITKATDWCERMHQSQPGQQPDAWMSPQPLDPLITSRLLLQPVSGLENALVQRLERLQPLIALVLHHRRHRCGPHLCQAGVGK